MPPPVGKPAAASGGGSSSASQVAVRAFNIKNKMKRQEVNTKRKQEKKDAKRERREKRQRDTNDETTDGTEQPKVRSVVFKFRFILPTRVLCAGPENFGQHANAR